MSSVVCSVCPHACKLVPGKVGVCGVRGAEGGSGHERVVSLNYGKATALALDPIEKKPLARFYPGSYILSYGSFGCNLRCAFCQNSDISTATAARPSPYRFVSPEELIAEALAVQGSGNIGIAFTYNEPLIAPEYVVDTGSLAHDAGLMTVAVTNGYLTQDTWTRVLPHLDALNIDLKCFSGEGYRSLGAPGGLAVVKESIRRAHDAGAHVEVTTLIVPGLSDDEDLFREECAWLASVDPGMPLHLSRFFPRHKATQKVPTEVALLERFAQIAREYLEWVFIGNV